jgi:hypothetical protein
VDCRFRAQCGRAVFGVLSEWKSSMKHRLGGRNDRHWLGDGGALATLILSGLAAMPAAAQETRFYLRSGTAVCGTVLGEQGSSMTVQTSNGLQVILRRDQIARRQVEACEAPAPVTAAAPMPAAAAPAAAAGASVPAAPAAAPVPTRPPA